MKFFRIILWGMVFVLGAFLAYTTIQWTLNGPSSPEMMGKASIGGPFTALNENGEVITQNDLIGRPHVLFFGFTHCPDVCPTTLYEGSQWLKELGPDGDKVDIYFVTVDPERDSAPILKEYLSGFDPRISGITGTSEQINQMSKAWRVFARKEREEGDNEDEYTMSHTATTFLMDAAGEFVGTIAYGESQDIAVQKLRNLIAKRN